MSSTPPSGSSGERARIYNGRYELIRQVARGGTAQVYLARDLLLDRPVALKVLFPELSTDPSFVERFRREAQAAANLSHPNIVPIFDWGESERTYFIVMEYVDGEPLSAIIRSQAPLPAARAAGIAADISKALSYAHRHGVVHRDVKPGNVLLTRDGQVKVGDFGIARAIGTDDNVTQTGLVMGTATYFSPEQAQGLGVDGRSDVYALGVVLYEMVTGRPPFSADTPVAIAYKHVSETAVSPREVEPRVPEALDAIIMRAIAKNPADRYPTAEDFYADLQRYSQGAPVAASSGPPTLGATQALGATTVLPAEATTAIPAGGTTAMAATQVSQSSELAGGTKGGVTELPRRRWVGWAIAGVLLAVALGLIVYFGGRSLGYFGASSYVHVPAVTGEPIAKAVNQLNRRGLVVSDRPEHSKAKKGTVISQNPRGSALVRQGKKVYLVYSGGLQKVAVPRLAGENYKKAERELKSKDLGYSLVPVAPSRQNEQQGIVTKTDPASGAMVLPGRKVTLYYVHGKQMVVVPGTSGDSVAEASNQLGAHQLAVGQTIYQTSQTVRKGLVIGTSPASGQQVAAGTPVELIVSSGTPSTVPPVVGDTEAQAEESISAAGLTYNVVYVNGLPSDNGYVSQQSPSGGTPEPKGYSVTIDVVRSATTSTGPSAPSGIIP